MQHIEQAGGDAAAPRRRRRSRVGSLLSNHMCHADIAEETGTCERTAQNEMERLNVPYVRFGNVRWYNRDDVRAALLARTVSKAPRARGRPTGRKVARTAEHRQAPS